MQSKTKRNNAEMKREFAFNWDESACLDDFPVFYKRYRKRAWENYQLLPMPTTKDESWRHTDISDLFNYQFRINVGRRTDVIKDGKLSVLKNVGASEGLGGKVVIGDEKNSSLFLSKELESAGVVFTTLKDALINYPELVKKVLGQVVSSDESKFVALTQAFEDSGIFVYIPKGIKVELPLYGIDIRQGELDPFFAHNILWLDEGAELIYVRETKSFGGNRKPELRTGVTEIIVGNEAKLTLIDLQNLGKNVWNFSHERAQIHQKGEIKWIYGVLGSYLSKNYIETDLIEQGGNSQVFGFYFADENQHLDIDTMQRHSAPNTTSNLLFKGVVKDNSHSIWRGMIYVAPEAQKTDGYQTNNNLILSEEAKAESIPGLEILADDVRCSHGATVGQVDKDEIFYLESRGIPETDAVGLIVNGYFDSIIKDIPMDAIREEIRKKINQKVTGKKTQAIDISDKINM